MRAAYARARMYEEEEEVPVVAEDPVDGSLNNAKHVKEAAAEKVLNRESHCLK